MLSEITNYQQTVLCEAEFASGGIFWPVWQNWMNQSPEPECSAFYFPPQHPLSVTILKRAVSLWPQLAEF